MRQKKKEPFVISGSRMTAKRTKIYRKGKDWLCHVLIFVLFILGCTGCTTEQTDTPSQKNTKEVVIPVIFTVNPTTGKKSNEELADAFNAKYKGTYRVEVEWVMETEEEYRQNLKRLNVTDALPAVITDLRMLPSFYQMMIKEKRLVNLAPFLFSDEEWLEWIEPVVLEGCMESAEEIYLAPISTVAFSCSGVFWNQELFAQAGISEFPTTWSAFWNCCEQLSACGITPLALHTEGTAWAPMLAATAELADTKKGAEFMKQFFPESYQNVSGIQLAETLKQLFQYTTEDALHTDFDVAFTNFFSGKAAMIPNGYWMIEQIPENFKEKVRFSAFPGNKLISSPETFGWAVVSSYPEEVQEGAVEFLKFRTLFNQKEKQRLIESGEESDNPTTKDYIQTFLNDPQIVPNYQVKWNSILQEETLGDTLPEFVKGKMTTSEFLEKLDESILQFQKEQ